MADTDENRASSYEELASGMRAVHVTRIGEMPRIQLYLDQVLTFVNEELSFMEVPGEVALTGSMVNNYVKQHVIPAPEKKRYTRRHLATLLFVCAFKRAFSMAQVKAILDMCHDSDVDMARAYDDLCGVIEHAIATEFPPVADERDSGLAADVHFFDEAGSEVATDVARLMGSGVVCVVSKVYVEQMLLLAEG
ncbi:MAG: DUF1836 domain-containing protein [Atopobiaceae bacterium]|jgi:DNA-binding transcriptional MerR regulator|nr:DUF1836 domain-containing protein [Atopobiaceae bacterium]MCI2174161.1 DUF1836 domain-containing protein [Atopobiaceae bacterium]MCI2206802.1 DUF1836 domain-containing protein [Atopobiaceae bacterium]